MRLKHALQWLARRSAIVVALLLIAAATLLIWFLASGFSANAATASIGIAAISALFAAISSIASLLQAVEAQKQRESQERPYVITDFDAGSNRLIYFVIQNSGNSPALNTKIQFDPAPVDYSGRRLNQVSLFEKPISFLSPGKTFRQLVDVGHKLLADGKPTKFRVSISYESIHGEIYRDSTEHDLAYLKQATAPGRSIEDNLGAMSEELKKLVTLLDSVRGRGFANSILVESPEEHEARLQQLLMRTKAAPKWKLLLRSFLERILSKLE